MCECVRVCMCAHVIVLLCINIQGHFRSFLAYDLFRSFLAYDLFRSFLAYDLFRSFGLSHLLQRYNGPADADQIV